MMLVIRKVTQRKEAVKEGVVKLVDTKEQKTILETFNFLENESNYNEMISMLNTYGDGTASYKIVDILKKVL